MQYSGGVLIIGNGKMAKEYARVYRDGFLRSFSVAGRSLERAEIFRKEEHGQSAYLFEAMSDEQLRTFSTIVVATSEESLEPVAHRLIQAKVARVLLEKPGTLSASSTQHLAKVAETNGCFFRIACNRRYYPSVLKLREILRDEPALSAYFEFTEVSSQISALQKPPGVKARWGLVNPIHVFDTLSFLLGDISKLSSQYSGREELPWHPISSIFQGTAVMGKTPVVYGTNWLSPGRWNIEVMTNKGRYKLSPMEKLVVMRHDSKFQWLDIEAPASTEASPFKPGLYEMVKSFEHPESCHLPDLNESTLTLSNLSQIFGYPL